MGKIKAHPDLKRKRIWLATLDKDKTLQNGRRVGKEYCLPMPQLQEFVPVMTHLGYPFCIQKHKFYPRENDKRRGGLISYIKPQQKTHLQVLKEIGILLQKKRAFDKKKAEEA